MESSPVRKLGVLCVVRIHEHQVLARRNMDEFEKWSKTNKTQLNDEIIKKTIGSEIDNLGGGLTEYKRMLTI